MKTSKLAALAFGIASLIISLATNAQAENPRHAARYQAMQWRHRVEAAYREALNQNQP